jgi:tetratricopeptide (TPR) repeat protein
LVEEALENNLGDKVMNERFWRWDSCSLCKQKYHGVVACALGWACWKTYLGRPEGDLGRRMAVSVLGNGLSDAGRHQDALFVREAELAAERRLGASEYDILAARGNLANSYQFLGRLEEALPLRRDVYSGHVNLKGEEHEDTLGEANNYANCLILLQRFEEAKSLLRKMIPVARRVLGESHELTLKMQCAYAQSLYRNTAATLDDLREAVETLEDAEQTARRVLGGAHPLMVGTEQQLRKLRELLAAREALREAKAAEAITPGERVTDKE